MKYRVNVRIRGIIDIDADDEEDAIEQLDSLGITAFVIQSMDYEVDEIKEE